MIHPEDLDRLQTATSRCKNESDSFTEEFRIVRPDGAVRWLYGTGLLVHEDGVRKMIGLNFDITEEKREEERKNMLMAELDHRVRNILSSVLAIASQSAHDDSTIGGFLDAFTGRVNALAHAHTLLSRSGWQGASVLNLIRNALVPYEGNGNVKTDGEPVLLRPGASQLCAMALHELATNAAKYGALSSSNGSVAVSWAIADGRSKDRKLVVDWRESGGPKVVEPARRGFGTMVLQEMLKYELNADVKTTFAPKGLTCRISIPLEQILALPVSDDSPASDGRELPSPRT
jgi:two-component sensor histidine kinase